MDPSAIVNMLMSDASRSNSALCRPPLITELSVEIASC